MSEPEDVNRGLLFHVAAWIINVIIAAFFVALALIAVIGCVTLVGALVGCAIRGAIWAINF